MEIKRLIMSDKKFDLYKFLQQPKLFTPIDYSGIVVPDLSGVQQTVDNLDEWRKSQGYRTNEEKLKEAQEKASAAMAELGNSEDVYDWYNAFQDDPKKQAEFRQQGAQGAGLLMTVPLTIASAGTMGWIPALTSTATGFAGAYGGQKLGEAIDTKYGTNTTPWLALAGGFAGGIGGYKGLVKAGSAGLLKGSGQMYGKQFVGDVMNDSMKSAIHKTNLGSKEPLLNVGWAPKQILNVRRAGELSEMYYPQRWDVVEEGANPFGVWLQGKFGTPRTDFTNPGKGAKAAKARELFANRPQYVGEVTFKKPIEVIGDVKDRSALSYNAERLGADGIIYNGFYDNGYNNNQGIFSFVKPELSSSSGKPARIMWMGPTTGKTTYAKTNKSIVDIDPLTKNIRKDVAKKLGLDFRDPKVSESPEYQQAIVDMVNVWLKDPTNHGKTLVASTKHLLDPKYGIKFANEPFIPDFETFVARNQARGFRETPEQLRKWYDSILEIRPNIKVDNRYISEILNPQQ